MGSLRPGLKTDEDILESSLPTITIITSTNSSGDPAGKGGDPKTERDGVRVGREVFGRGCMGRG